MKKNLYFLLAVLLMGTGSIMAQEVKSVKHDYVYDGNNFTEEFSMTFDNQGRLVSSHCTANGIEGYALDIECDETYTYSGNTIEGELVQKVSGMEVGTTKFRYQLSNGLLVSSHQEAPDGAGGLIMVDGAMEYDSNGRMKKDATTNYFDGGSVTDYGYYTWTGGNLTGYDFEEDGQITHKATNTFGKQSTSSQMLGHLFGGTVTFPYHITFVGVTVGALLWAGPHSDNLMTERTVNDFSEGKTINNRYEYDMDGNGLINTIRVFTDGQHTDTYYITWGENSSIHDIATSHPDSQWYSLNGHAVSQPKKGIYIRNGKKVLLK